jgi:hypothetical protein
LPIDTATIDAVSSSRRREQEPDLRGCGRVLSQQQVLIILKKVIARRQLEDVFTGWCVAIA